eukprot:CAMPEP_0115850356 /NCGR_PEP_ID=MMETSP0287-20121206/11923_1 /TAXON_ID=412157 /ORGANISM="Chrysochromulina rotalis, Strain UIO044" /LENGTH=54 /DNA_ID=CAMNT_0003304353 /DNA_START=400 /DNA_END=560 /DNA_ORIENTATION=-
MGKQQQRSSRDCGRRRTVLLLEVGAEGCVADSLILGAKAPAARLSTQAAAVRVS